MNKLKPNKCLKCGKVLDGCSSLEDDTLSPNPGDITAFTIYTTTITRQLLVLFLTTRSSKKHSTEVRHLVHWKLELIFWSKYLSRFFPR